MGAGAENPALPSTKADGIGDLEEIRRKLDHPTFLGDDAVWFGPINRSQFVDFGYGAGEY